MSERNPGFPSRRDLFGMGSAAGALALIAKPSYAQAVGMKSHHESGEVNVHAFGAIGDAVTDDSAAFQRALDAVGSAGGGIVYAPTGRYLFKSELNIPVGVHLRGSYLCVPSHNGLRDQGQPKPGEDGTALYVVAGKGNEDGKPFLTLNTNSSVSGLSIYYPEQNPDAEPIRYPWTIAMRGKNPAAFDVELLNPYQGIDASRNERHNVRNITGQPLRRGILVDAIYDIGRIENIHFNPWWNSSGKAYKWQLENGEAFIFGRADWEYVLNTFCYAYKVGYKFISSSTGECNGNFLGIGADNCNRAILVEQSAEYGLLIANAEFTSFTGENPTMVEVCATNRGVVRIGNSAFWGPCNQIATIGGTGTVGFSDCTFVQWGAQGERAAIQASAGRVLVRGCEFRLKKPHISLGSAVDCAVVTGNVFAGPARIEYSPREAIQIGLNAASA